MSLATLRLMEQLSPPERAVFVLRTAFEFRTTRSPVCDAGRNRTAKEQRVREGRAHAALVFRGFPYNGALSTYERLGFVPDRQIGKHRWVVRRVAEPRSD